MLVIQTREVAFTLGFKENVSEQILRTLQSIQKNKEKCRQFLSIVMGVWNLYSLMEQSVRQQELNKSCLVQHILDTETMTKKLVPIREEILQKNHSKSSIPFSSLNQSLSRIPKQTRKDRQVKKEVLANQVYKRVKTEIKQEGLFQPQILEGLFRKHFNGVVTNKLLINFLNIKNPEEDYNSFRQALLAAVKKCLAQQENWTVFCERQAKVSMTIKEIDKFRKEMGWILSLYVKKSVLKANQEDMQQCDETLRQ